MSAALPEENLLCTISVLVKKWAIFISRYTGIKTRNEKLNFCPGLNQGLHKLNHIWS